MNCAEYREWVAADVDGVLGAAERAARAHLEGCSACRRLRTAQEAVRATLRSRALGETAPPGLRTRILAGIREGTGEADAGFPFGRIARWASLLAAGLAALVILRPTGGDALEPLVEEYYAALRGDMRLAVRTESVDEVERYYRSRPGPALPGHVVDLESAGFRLVGATVREVEGRPHRFTVYSDGKNLVLCDYRRVADYAGDLPANGEPRFFSRAGLTFCVRRMGDEVCILVTRMPRHVVVPRLLGWT